MAMGLEEAWQNLKLTTNEEQVITVDDEEDDSTSELISLCLLGHLYTSNSFNHRVMKVVFKNVWKSSKVLVPDLDSNLFAFQFFSVADKEFALNEGPWVFNGCILLLKQMTGLEVPSLVEFLKARFWFKAYDVPGKKHTVSFARLLASNIGEFISWNEATMLEIDKALCFRVDINISKPLGRGVYIKIVGNQLWIKFRYVKPPDFCYNCGKLGPVLATCNLAPVAYENDNFQHRVWLCTSPIRSRRRATKAELLEERKLFMALKNKLPNPNA